MHIGAAHGPHPGPDPGVLDVPGTELCVGCGHGTSIVFDEVQMEGKRRMSAAEFLRGFQIRAGERLGL
jgi:methionyl-tRNA formyltransferase